MAIELPKARLSEAPRRRPQEFPINQYLAVMGQNPVANAIDQVGPAISQALQRRMQLRQQAQTNDLVTKGLGLDVPAGTDLARIPTENLIQMAQAKTAAQKANSYDFAGLSQDGKNMIVLNKREGTTELRPLPAGFSPKNPQSSLDVGLKEQQFNDRYAMQIGDRINKADTGTRATMAVNRQKLNNIGAAKALIDQVEQQPGGADQRQMFEVALSTVRSLMSNNSLTEGEIKMMMPQTYKGSFDKFLEKLTNDPQGLDQQAFVSRYKDTLRREYNTADKQLSDAQNRVYGFAVPWLNRHPEYAGPIFQQAHIYHPKYNPNEPMDVNVFDSPPSQGGQTAGAGSPSLRPLPSPQQAGGRIRVRNKATGQTGTISQQYFDPSKYEQVQ